MEDTSKIVNEALWEEARVYYKAGVGNSELECWQNAFRCWFTVHCRIHLLPLCNSSKTFADTLQ